MNSKLIFPILMAFSTVWAVQWYFGRKADQIVQNGVVNVAQEAEIQGGVIKVQKTQDLLRPLNTQVEFAAQKSTKGEEIEKVETDHVIATFSSFGGQLKELVFKDYLGKNKKPIKTVYDRGIYDEQAGIKHCFLLSLDKNTPYVYRLVNRESDDMKDTLIYQSENDEWIVQKTFLLYKATYKIDVSVLLTSKSPNSGVTTRPRMFFVAPVVHELLDDAVVPFMFSEANNAIEKSDISKINDCAWHWGTQKVIFGAENRYFAHTIINDSSKFAQRAYFNVMNAQDKATDSKNVNVLSAILEGPEIVADKEPAQWTMSFYMGPKVYQQLAAVDERLQDLLSFGWLSWLCTLMLQLLAYLYNLIGNYGLAIIALTVVVRIPFVPLSIFSRRRMEEYQKHQPHINRIRAKYKTDPKVQQHEIIRYHREHNLSPATPVIGCLPLLIQVPILLSLYRVLWSYLDLYQAPFFGWIVDLSAKDPYYVLPVLMGVTMIWQQSLTAVQDEKQRVISWFMGIVMTVLFASFPAGLVLYWLMNNVLTLVEDYARKAFTR